MKSEVDFTSVVPAAQAGEKKAQDTLMAAFYAWSVTQVRRYVRDSERAKDIAVDFWTWLFQEGGIEEFDAAKGAFYPWMERMLKYRALHRGPKEPQLVYYGNVNDPETWDSADPLGDSLSALQDLEAVAAALKSSTIITLSVNSNPGADVAAGTTYPLYRDTYPMPVAFQTADDLIIANQSAMLQYVHPAQWLGHQRSRSGPLGPRTSSTPRRGSYQSHPLPQPGRSPR